MKRFTALFSILLLSLVVAFPASADISVFFYSLTGSEEKLTGSLGGDGSPCTLNGFSGTYYYATTNFSVTASGDYTIYDARNDLGLEDGRLGIYTGPFDPSNYAVNCLAFYDDNNPAPAGFAVTLNAGTTYTMVLSSYQPDAIGEFGFYVDGPGEIAFSGASGAAFDPGDDRINPDAHAPVAIYCRDNGAVEVLNIDASGNGSQAFLLTSEDISAGAAGSIVTQVGNVSLYKLADGRLQINAVLLDGKGYAFLWNACPVSYSETYTIENGQSSLLIARSY